MKIVIRIILALIMICAIFFAMFAAGGLGYALGIQHAKSIAICENEYRTTHNPCATVVRYRTAREGDSHRVELIMTDGDTIVCNVRWIDTWNSYTVTIE